MNRNRVIAITGLLLISLTAAAATPASAAVCVGTCEAGCQAVVWVGTCGSDCDQAIGVGHCTNETAVNG